MDRDGVDLGVEEINPELADAIEVIAGQLGLPIRRRCCMPEAASQSVNIWRHRPVTASIRGKLPGLTEAQIVSVYKKALNIWNSAVNVGLQWTDDYDNANIWARCVKIDGSSGTLALSYLPMGGLTEVTSRRLQLEQRYDTSEGWQETWLLEVMLHELGHAIGLNHINQKGALMYPYSAGGRIVAPTHWELELLLPKYGGPTVPAPSAPAIVGGTLVLADNTVALLNGKNFDYGGRHYSLEAKIA